MFVLPHLATCNCSWCSLILTLTSQTAPFIAFLGCQHLSHIIVRLRVISINKYAHILHKSVSLSSSLLFLHLLLKTNHLTGVSFKKRQPWALLKVILPIDSSPNLNPAYKALSYLAAANLSSPVLSLLTSHIHTHTLTSHMNCMCFLNSTLMLCLVNLSTC